MSIPNINISDYPENALLPLDIINDLAKRFCIATDDRIKQDLVDQLGTHCINHAEFMRAIHDFTVGGTEDFPIARAYAIADYTNATKYLRTEPMETYELVMWSESESRWTSIEWNHSETALRAMADHLSQKQPDRKYGIFDHGQQTLERLS